MKQMSHAAIFYLFLLIMVSNTSARLLPLHQGEKSHEIIQQKAHFSNLMGLEECGDKDEACDKRRMVAEAHLDYIYTQHHHP